MKFARVGSCIIHGSSAFSVSPADTITSYAWSKRDGFHGPYFGRSIPHGLAVLVGEPHVTSTVFFHPVTRYFPLHVSRSRTELSRIYGGDRFRHLYVLYDDMGTLALASDREIYAQETEPPAWWPDEEDLTELELSLSVLGS